MLFPIVNKAKCKHCGDIIESTYRHDYKHCKCGKIAVDGGHAYARRLFPERPITDHIEELTILRDSDIPYLTIAGNVNVWGGIEHDWNYRSK